MFVICPILDLGNVTVCTHTCVCVCVCVCVCPCLCAHTYTCMGHDGCIRAVWQDVELCGGVESVMVRSSMLATGVEVSLLGR
jgi:hypothetical protein